MAGVDPADLVFLDETATPTTLTPLWAWAPRGQRAVGRVPRGRRTHLSWLAALTPVGIGPSVVVEVKPAGPHARPSGKPAAGVVRAIA